MPKVQRVYLRDSSDAEMIAAEVATDTPSIIPIHGKKRWKVHARGPSGPVTIALQERLRANSTLVTVATFTGTAIDDDTTPVCGEIGSIVVTNGAAAQRPEILVSLVEGSDA